VDLSGIYFATDDGGIGRLPLKGGEPLPFVAPGEHGKTTAFALDEFALFRAAGPALYRVPKGGDPETLVATLRAPIRAILRGESGGEREHDLVLALEDGTVVRRSKTPGGPDVTLARGKPGGPAAMDLALYAGHLYWGTESGIVRRAP
jgi:hypothetical protein